MAREHIIARSLESLNDIAAQFGTSWNPSFTRAYDMPLPFPGEAISSWLIRYAIRRNCSPGKILDWVGVDWPKPVYWMDFDAEALPWDYICKLTSCSPSLLKQCVPDNAQFMLCPELLCLHTDPMRMQPHLRYCATCLANDPIPFYRTTWRLSSSWICLEHGEVMRDYCPTCRAPLFWNYAARSRIKISDLRMCYHCGGDLCAIAPPAYLPIWLTAEVTAIQMEFSHLLGLRKTEEQIPDIASIEIGENGNPITASLAMQTSLREAYVQQHKPSAVEIYEKLAKIVRILDFSPIAEASGPQIGVGIEAKMLFGRGSAQACRALMEHQNLFGTTLWWPGENILKNALRETWANADFDRTKQWVLRHCRSSQLPESPPRS